MQLNGKLKDYINGLSEKGLLRTRNAINHDDTEVLHFDSNDYLSLRRHLKIMAGYQKGYDLFPCGSSGSMFLNGYHQSHQILEKAFANWLHVDECVLFTSGYAANLAVMSLLGALKVACLIDKGVHASVYDGLKLGGVAYKRYLHNDLGHAAGQIKKSSKETLLFTEGIFSMSGQVAPLAALSFLCGENNMQCLVDEAHAIGCLGEEGRGAVAYHGLGQKEVPLRIIPLGKAFAGSGAIIAGESEWIQALLQAGRSLIYSTAASPAMSYGLLNTLEVLALAEDRRLKLYQLIQYLREIIPQSPLKWADSVTAIQQVQLGCPHLALYYAQELFKQGICCSAIRQPTVSKKASGLRIILNYHHQPEDIDNLFKQLAFIHDHLSK